MLAGSIWRTTFIFTALSTSISCASRVRYTKNLIPFVVVIWNIVPKDITSDTLLIGININRKRESDLLIKSIITDRNGQRKVLLSINHKYYSFWES